MTDVASYTFLPWLRRGVSTAISRVDGEADSAARATFAATVLLDAHTDGGTVSRSAGATLELYGPGEIAGIDTAVVARTWPMPDSSNVESNLFPAIEFDQADFPWRYTPARAGDADRLRPWLVLVTLADEEIETYTEPGADGSLASLTVAAASLLPDLAQSWAWAHGQVSGLEESEDLASVIDDEPERVISRLLCPRRLDAGTRYTAFLVPAFARGRYAALGDTIPDDLDAMEPAWQASDASVRLPVYYEWSFETGIAGDFEYLVRQLRARVAPSTIGKRDMDVASPGMGLPAAADAALGIEGALKSPTMERTSWADATRDTFVASLASLLGRPADLLETPEATRVVAPPLYGCWHAQADRLEPDEKPRWFNELNADPRHRVAGGLGTLVVQSQQQQLMASAWQQIGEVRTANERLRRAQLSREASVQLYDRHVVTLDAQSQLLVTAPVLTRVLAGPRTVASVLAGSPIAAGAFEPRLRRMMRPFGRLAKRQGREAGGAPTLLDRMNTGALSPAPPPSTPEGMSTPGRTGSGLAAASAAAAPAGGLASGTLRMLAIILVALAIVALLLGWRAAALLLAAAAIVCFRAVPRAERAAAARGAAGAVAGLRPSPGEIAAATPAPSFGPATGTTADATPHPSPAPGVDRARAIDALRSALVDLVAETGTPPAAGPELVPADLSALAAKVVTALDPRTTIAASINTRFTIGPGIAWDPADPLDQVMAAPEFAQPMYEPLRDLSQAWLLPGADRIPSNTVCLLETNQPFVESYMVGLNHEMARELLWNEYPTDQRGTCFRQFWDVRGYVAPEGETVDPETLRDILPIHDWKDASTLGENGVRELPDGDAYLVLLVRGDVLRRFPNTIVYACEAELDGNDDRALGTEERYPLFRGTLEPDMTFFGFALTPAEVRGSTDAGADQGWFFVLQEQPTEPRFGLDFATTYAARVRDWNDISWGSLAADAGALAGMRYVDLDAELPETSVSSSAGDGVTAWHADAGDGDTGSRASDLAYITFQRPFRVAIHGSDMLAEDA
jgi:hypothetical protein